MPKMCTHLKWNQSVALDSVGKLLVEKFSMCRIKIGLPFEHCIVYSFVHLLACSLNPCKHTIKSYNVYKITTTFGAIYIWSVLIIKSHSDNYHSLSEYLWKDNCEIIAKGPEIING